MFQLAFGLGTDVGEPSIGWNLLRGFCAMLDTVVYQLIVLVYQVLFTIADSSILSSEFIKDFYGRFQLIIGVFMIFKLSVSILQAVINPDVLTDQKNGMSKIITRIITMLLMFSAIIPLNIPNTTSGSYNAYLNQHGLLFGTMYSLQARVLDQGTIEKLILGKVDSGGDEDTEEIDSESGINKKESANRMASYMLKAFVSINMKENASGAGDNDEKNYMCPVDEIDADKKEDKGNVYDVYKEDASSPMEILKYINTTCNYESLGDKIWGQNGRYALAYFPIVPTICGGLVLYVLLSFCIDVAVRSLKLAILRLIAPIPIMSYISPKSSENGSFANWTKLLISTFLNLFIILAIVFFTISVVSKIADKDQTVLSLPISDEFSVVNTIATVFIIVGVFFFAKQAPKFIMDALGIKGMGLGAGLSGALGAAGALMGGAGLSGALAGGLTAMNNASEAAATGKQAPSAWSTGSDLAAKIRTGDPNAKGGFTQSWQRAAMNLAANRHGFGQAVEDKGYFGDESEAARQHINQLNRDIAAEQGNLSSLKAQQESNNLNIQNTKDALKNNFSENMRDRINELRRNGYSNNDIQSALSADYSTEDLGQYFGMENSLNTYQSQAATLQGQISASESRISAHQSELRETEVYKGEMDYNKGKAQEGVDKMYKIYGNVGNASQNGDSRYSARTRNGRPW